MRVLIKVFLFLFIVSCSGGGGEAVKHFTVEKKETFNLELPLVLESISSGDDIVVIKSKDSSISIAEVILTLNPNSLFTVDSNLNIILAPGVELDYESDTSYTIEFSVIDSRGNKFKKSVTITIEDENDEPPSNIVVNKAPLLENELNGFEVATIASEDMDNGDSHTYSLIDDAGGRFSIKKNRILVADSNLIDFETNTTFNIVARITDLAGNFVDESISLSIVDAFDEVPSDILLEGGFVGEGSLNGVSIGLLETVDADINDTHTYTLIDNANGRFAISNNEIVLLDTAQINRSNNLSHNIKVRSTDSGGLFREKAFVINVGILMGNCPTLFTSDTAHDALGSGTLLDPYFLINESQFSSIPNNTNYHYELCNSLDFSVYYGAGNSEFKLGGVFAGVMEGNGFSLSNFTRTSQQDWDALIESLSGTVQNLQLENFVVNGKNLSGFLAGEVIGNATIQNIQISGLGSSLSGENGLGALAGQSIGTGVVISKVSIVDGVSISGVNYIGGLVGYVDGDLNLSHSSSQGIVSGNTFIGGLIGLSDITSGEIKEVFSSASVQAQGDNAGGLLGGACGASIILDSYALGDVSGVNNVGGFVGQFFELPVGEISRSYSTGNTTLSGNNGGGFIGLLDGGAKEISHSFSTGNVSGGSSLGEFVGSVNIGTITNSYFDQDLSSSCASCNSLALATDKTQFYYTSNPVFLTYWDFKDRWQEVDNTYPTHEIIADDYVYSTIQTYGNSASNSVAEAQAAELGITLFPDVMVVGNAQRLIYVNDIIKHFIKAPFRVLKEFMKGNLSLDIVMGGVTSHPIYAYLSGTQVPGWPPGSTWDDVPGLGDTYTCVIAADSLYSGHGSNNLILHELAHTFELAPATIPGADYTYKVSEEPTWVALDGATNYNWGGYTGTYMDFHAREAFAEAFAMYYHNAAKQTQLRNNEANIVDFLEDFFQHSWTP